MLWWWNKVVYIKEVHNAMNLSSLSKHGIFTNRRHVFIKYFRLKNDSKSQSIDTKHYKYTNLMVPFSWQPR